MSLAIVIPAHNERDRIDRTLHAYRTGFSSPDVEFHVALDGCGDGTGEIVARHAGDDARVHLHEYPKLGKGGVLLETFRRCDTDLVGFVDADCATPPAELARLARAAHETGGAIASRRLPASITPGHRPAMRAVTSSGFAWLIRRLFALPYADTQCGAKVFRKPELDDVLPEVSSRDFLFDVDLLVAARRAGVDVVELPTVWVDQAGSKVKPARDTARMLRGTITLWWRRRRPAVEPTGHGPDADRDVVGDPPTGDARTGAETAAEGSRDVAFV